ncbi:MAG: hypothetical protein KF893_16310 [Caldilineaceae bacterium]|nr:hypothetical protein [Caldilineaceae bacterium]
MGFLKKLFGSTKLDGVALAQSARLEDYAQIDLLGRFSQSSPLHEERARRQWERILPRSYEQQIELLQKQNWLQQSGDRYQITEAAHPPLALYRARQQREKEEAMRQVRKALTDRDTSEALALRRSYEATQPLGRADWTGPEPQLSHSALTRRILFLQHRIIDGLSASTAQWLKLYAAEQHLWGVSWRLDKDAIPDEVATELAIPALDSVEAAYWRAYGLVLYVENQETWQRCKGGDHVRRIEIGGLDDEYTCASCRQTHGEQYLVTRVPELPHSECTSPLGCRCTYVPVLDTYEELAE